MASPPEAGFPVVSRQALEPMDKKTSHLPIVVAGAGPVGLFTAVLLVEAGYPVLVLDRNSGLARDTRASTFPPATLDLLEELGLDQPLIACGSISQGWQYMIHGTKRHAVFDLAVISDLTHHPYRLQCEQFHLTGLLLERLEANPLFEIRFNHEVTSVRRQADGAAFGVRWPGGEAEWRADWLIAADGGGSTVRRRLGLPFEGGMFPRTSITLVLDYPFQEHVDGLLGVNYVWTETGHYTLIQIRNLWRFSYSPDPGQSIEDALSEPVAQSHLQSLFPRARPYTVLQRNHYTLQQRCLESFRSGRVLFAGDAAHLNSPVGGMGMNSGIHDAHCLAQHLLPVLQGADEALLDRYSRRRRTVALEEVQRLSERNYRWHGETDPSRRDGIWRELQEIVQDRQRTRDFLLESSMIRSRLREQEID
jgi:2-polyprenyl-6-methoxyphenol hydroxylase-like FAD-dependent oxidoreductase